MSNYIDIERHKHILGILYVVFSSLHLLFVFVGVVFLSELIPVVSSDQESIWVFNLVRSIVIVLTLVLTLPGLIAGIGLINKKDWGLLVAFIISIIALPLFPFWTFISIYTIVIFIMSQRKAPTAA